MNPLRQACLDALALFIQESSNENKMELHIVYEDIEDSDKEKVLGQELNAILERIIKNNDHPDSYLETIDVKLFS